MNKITDKILKELIEKDKNEKNREIYHKRFFDEKRTTTISKEVGVTKQWVAENIARFIRSIIFSCSKKCIEDILYNNKNKNRLFVQSFLSQLAKFEDVKVPSKKEFIEAMKNVSGDGITQKVEEYAKIFGYAPYEFAIIAGIHGYKTDKGKIIIDDDEKGGKETPRNLFDKILNEKGAEGVDIDELVETIKKEVPLYSKAWLSTTVSHINNNLNIPRGERICRRGNRIFFCRYVDQYLSKEKIEQYIRKAIELIKKNDSCFLDVRLIDDKEDPYLIKSVLTVFGDEYFENERPFVVRYKKEGCKEEPYKTLDDMIIEILKERGPMTFDEISKILKEKYLRLTTPFQFSNVASRNEIVRDEETGKYYIGKEKNGEEKEEKSAEL